MANGITLGTVALVEANKIVTERSRVHFLYRQLPFFMEAYFGVFLAWQFKNAVALINLRTFYCLLAPLLINASRYPCSCILFLHAFLIGCVSAFS